MPVTQATTENPSSAESTSNLTAAALRFAAMNYLARREHSRLELQQKLTRRFIVSANNGGEFSTLLDSVLEQLRDENLQSDWRFAESFASARMRRGQGPLRIVHDLKQKGVEAHIIDAVVDIGLEQWLAIARDVIDKKYGGIFLSPTERAKQSRFLQYRGFSLTQIQLLMRE